MFVSYFEDPGDHPSGHTGLSRNRRKEIHHIPLWVALRWLVVCLVRGPRYAEHYIRPEDRP